MGEQFPRSEVETWKKWDAIEFDWNKFVVQRTCRICNYSCKSYGIAKKHFDEHDRMFSK